MKKNFAFLIIFAVILIVVLVVAYCLTVGNQKIQGIKVLSPNGGEVWTRDQKVEISWNAEKEVKSVNIRLAIQGSEDSQNFNAAIAADFPNTGKYEWIVQNLYAEVLGVTDLPASDKYIVIIEDKDRNNIYDTSDVIFSIK